MRCPMRSRNSPGAASTRSVGGLGAVDAARAVVDRGARASHAPFDDLPGAFQFGDSWVDLGEREPGGLAQPNDVQAGDDGAVIAALTADAGGRVDEADLLVVAQRGRGDAGLEREFTDRQAGGHGYSFESSLT